MIFFPNLLFYGLPQNVICLKVGCLNLYSLEVGGIRVDHQLQIGYHKASDSGTSDSSVLRIGLDDLSASDNYSFNKRRPVIKREEGIVGNRKVMYRKWVMGILQRENNMEG